MIAADESAALGRLVDEAMPLALKAAHALGLVAADINQAGELPPTALDYSKLLGRAHIAVGSLNALAERECRDGGDRDLLGRAVQAAVPPIRDALEAAFQIGDVLSSRTVLALRDAKSALAAFAPLCTPATVN